jgi:PAS domain S-box-containing protein
VVIGAPYGRDAGTVSQLLRDRGYETVVAGDLSEVAARIDAVLGVVLLTEEILAEDLGDLKRAMVEQEPWSNPPFVVLSGRRTGAAYGPEAARLRLADFVTNLVVLERPMGAVSLVSAVDSALRTRQKQFELRDQIAQLAASRKALADSEAELRLITDSLPVLIGFIGPDYRYRFVNRAYEDWLYRPQDEIIGKTVRELAGEAAFALRKPAMDRALAGEPGRLEVSWPHRDGRRREADVRYIPRFDADGEVDGFHVFVTDITDRRETAETLERLVKERTAELHREMANRTRAEAALRQSQKMEAVGQLTGGIAHDFNNMLTGVIGALDMMRRRIAAGRTDDLPRFMSAATASAQRAASLTARLLAFSRRQSLDSKPQDINALVLSLEDLLRRTVSERVVLGLALADDLPAGVADTNQLESAILNLAINARDAMPDGGQLTIETALVEVDQVYASTRPEARPGRYVAVSVSDTGVGMDAAVLEQVFDPFFTTKPLGQGTGLGLSMVYGFAKQNGGFVRAHSAVGVGTTVTLYLPASDREDVPRAAAPAPAALADGGGRTVLVVEDDEAVRLLVREVLTELGYHAVEASDGLRAVPILASERRIDLLVSDVGLPGMNGRELAEVARRHRPDLPILFVTGYAENAAIRASFLGANMVMITKPFALDALAAKVSELLAAGPPAAPGAAA